MSSSSWIRMRVRTLFALVLLTALASGGASAQSEVECIAYDVNDLPRECTFLEEWGQCLDAAYDSYLQCVDDTGEEEPEGFFAKVADFFEQWAEEGVCQAAATVDNTACTIETPFARVLS